jgi:hypothetical protein
LLLKYGKWAKTIIYNAKVKGISRTMKPSFRLEEKSLSLLSSLKSELCTRNMNYVHADVSLRPVVHTEVW